MYSRGQPPPPRGFQQEMDGSNLQRDAFDRIFGAGNVRVLKALEALVRAELGPRVAPGSCGAVVQCVPVLGRAVWLSFGSGATRAI